MKTLKLIALLLLLSNLAISQDTIKSYGYFLKGDSLYRTIQDTSIIILTDSLVTIIGENKGGYEIPVIKVETKPYTIYENAKWYYTYEEFPDYDPPAISKTIYILTEKCLFTAYPSDISDRIKKYGKIYLYNKEK